MTAPRASHSGAAPGRANDLQDKRVSPLELFFDLVFVLALTQVTRSRVGRPDRRRRPARAAVKLAIFTAMAAMLAASLAVPGAFEGDAVLFAVAYLCVRLLHVLLFVAGTDDVDVRQAVRALAPSAVLAPSVLLASTAVDGALQVGVWVVALLIDYVGGALRGIDGWPLSPGHFAERHGLVVSRRPAAYRLTGPRRRDSPGQRRGPTRRPRER